MNRKAGKLIGNRALAVILTLVLLGTMVAGSTVSTFAAGTFSDLKGSVYEDDVEKLVDAGIINGYPDGTFKAQNKITRAEVCTVVTKAMNPGTPKMADAVDSGFPDIQTTSAWAATYINYATAMGVINGYPDGSFKPSNNVTYNELSAMLIRGSGITEAELTGKWPENYKSKALSLGIYEKVFSKLTSAQQSAFNYNAPATRGDAVLMVSAVLDQLKEQGKKGLPVGKSRTHVYEDGRYNWIDGDATALSIKRAVEIMQTEGVLAETAKANKASDEATLESYETTLKNLKSIATLLGQVGDIEASANGESVTPSADVTGLSSGLSSVLMGLISTSGSSDLLSGITALASLAGLNLEDILPEDGKIDSIQDLINTISKIKSMLNVTDLASEIKLYIEIVEAQRDFCKNNIENNNQAELNSIEEKTVALYYGVLQARENLAVCEENLDVQNKIMKNVELKYEVGTVAQIEVKNQKAAVLSAEQGVKEAKAALEEASMNFNMLLGYDVTDNIALTDDLTILAFPEKTVQEYVSSALKNRLTYKQVCFGMDIAKKSLDNEGKKSVESDTYKELQETYRSLNYAKNTLEKNIEIEVRSAYIDLINKYDAINNAISTLALAQDGLKVKQLMYENGLATLSDVQQAQLVVFQTNQLIMAKTAEYNIAVYSFDHITGVGTERINFAQEG